MIFHSCSYLVFLLASRINIYALFLVIYNFLLQVASKFLFSNHKPSWCQILISFDNPMSVFLQPLHLHFLSALSYFFFVHHFKAQETLFNWIKLLMYVKYDSKNIFLIYRTFQFLCDRSLISNINQLHNSNILEAFEMLMKQDSSFLRELP